MMMDERFWLASVYVFYLIFRCRILNWNYFSSKFLIIFLKNILQRNSSTKGKKYVYFRDGEIDCRIYNGDRITVATSASLCLRSCCYQCSLQPATQPDLSLMEWLHRSEGCGEEHTEQPVWDESSLERSRTWENRKAWPVRAISNPASIYKNTHWTSRSSTTVKKPESESMFLMRSILLLFVFK